MGPGHGQRDEPSVTRLEDLVIRRAASTPDALAVVAADHSLTYRELDRLANRLARVLASRGVGPGDRVALWLDKSAPAVAVMQAVLRLGAAYVPVDPLAPSGRCRTLLEDAKVAALVTDPHRATTLGDLPDSLALLRLAPPSHNPSPNRSARILGAPASRRLRPASPRPTPESDNPESNRPARILGAPASRRLRPQEVPASHPDDATSDWPEILAASPDPLPTPERSPHHPAYILYTSGSTGRPKGVCLGHANALAFVEWAHTELGATATDRLANHAPFHFDLSVLDLYVAFAAGASVHLVPDHLSFAAPNLVRFLAEERPTIWYSVPSVLVMMIEHGQLLELDELPLRALLFAGEPFPVEPLRRLRGRWPALRLLNLYGPTETNVCTFYEVGEHPPEHPLPIGRPCCGDHVWLRRDDGTPADPGEEGELMVEGPTVMLGYRGGEPQGERPYATGDLARRRPDGNFELLGRRDRMLKIRGHRIEPAELEATLERHPAIRRAAVVAVGQGLEARLVAFLVARPKSQRPSLLALKQHCARHLPRTHTPHRLAWLDTLPLTRNGKIDYRELGERAAALVQE